MDYQDINWFYVVGPLITMYGLFILVRAKKTRNWPAETGKIVKTVETYTEEYDPNYRSIRKGDYSFARMPKHRFSGVRSALQYVYIVSEKKYVGDTLYSAEAVQFGTPILKDIATGDLVKVFYNPNNPEDSFLAHSFTGKTIFIIVVGIAVTLSPILMEVIPKLFSQFTL